MSIGKFVKKNFGRAVLSLGLLSAINACSDEGGGESMQTNVAGSSSGSGSGAGGSGGGGSNTVELEDFLEVTLDGQVLPIDPDPDTASASSPDAVNIGFQTSLFDAAEVRLGNLVVDFGINKGVAGTYPLTDESSDLNASDSPLGYVSVELPDGTFYGPSEGSVICDSVIMSPDAEGRVRLESIMCTFEGMFEDGEDSTNVLPISGRFVYASSR
jgi:hypothetical protein